MLRVKKGRPPIERVPLGGNAWIDIRPATAFEVDRASASVAKMLVGLAAGEEAATWAAALLGQDVEPAEHASTEWRTAAANRIVVIELAMLCASGWGGVVDDDIGEPLPLTRENLALVLLDSEIATKVARAVNQRLHEVDAEGEGSAVSPAGVGETAEHSAPTAAP